MSGKSYTMKEMRSIVEYLIEHKAYGEIRGRKMWMNYANSKATNRTWQSLKETFLKRILPDIHNPYYKLSLHQISSFKQGYDVEKRLQQTLEFRETSKMPVRNGTDKINIEMNNDVDRNGETCTKSKVNTDIRDSTETLVLENCYATTEEIKRDLTSPNISEVPMVSEGQTVNDDLETDEGSDGEPPMEIYLGGNENVEDIQLLISDGEENNIMDIITLADNENSNKDVCPDEKEFVKPANKPEDESEISNLNSKDNVTQNVIKGQAASSIEKPKTVLTENKTTDMDTNSTPPFTMDSLLPNNQEEFQNKNENITSNTTGENNNSKQAKKRSLATSDKESTNDNIESNSSQVKKSRKKLTNIAHTKNHANLTLNISKNPAGNEEKKHVFSPSVENPCLRSASLYDQSNTIQSSDTESHNGNSKNKKLIYSPDNKKSKEEKKALNNEVLSLKSHSDSKSSDVEVTSPRDRPANSKLDRDKALAKALGFTSGAVRRRRQSRQAASHHATHDVSVSSGEWTSDTGSVRASPSRGRVRRRTRKYIKPKSSRIKSLYRDGGLFVVVNNKVYPLIRNRRGLKYCALYTSDSESDEGQKRWRDMYIEEKKKTIELERLLKKIEGKKDIDIDEAAGRASCSTNFVAATSTHRGLQTSTETASKLEEKREVVQNEKAVKIKFIKNNEEMQLEGPWSDLNTALAPVMQMFQRGPELWASKKPERAPEPQPSSVPETTCGDADVRVKIDNIENKIFKEIEEKDKHENSQRNEIVESTTKRSSPRTKKSSSINEASPSKILQTADQLDDPPPKQEVAKVIMPEERKKGSGKQTRQTIRQLQVMSDDKFDSGDYNITRRRRSKRIDNTSTTYQTTRKNNAEDNEDSEDVKYKFPPESFNAKKTKTNRLSKNTQQKKLNIYMTASTSLLSQNNQPQPAENCRDYQNTADSPSKISKFNSALSTSKNENLNLICRYNQNTLIDDATNESSNSYQSAPLPTLTFHNTTLSTEAYRSDSYQMLMPQDMQISNKNKKLNSSASNLRNACDYNMNFDLIVDYNRSEEGITPDSETHERTYSSSNVSPPTSPVLSIVENISVNKSFIDRLDDLSDDEYKSGNMDQSTLVPLNDVLKSNHEIPMSLLVQECKNIKGQCEDENDHYNNIVSTNTLTPASQSLINKLSTVDIKDTAVCNSINEKLSDLILDSNKKKNVKVKKSIEQQSKAKKRSSTPRKRQSTRKSKGVIRDCFIEEEHMETYSCSSQRSCPPVLQIHEFTPKQSNENNITNMTIEVNSKTFKEKRKKDVIKVKITKPKEKSNVSQNIRKPNITNPAQIDSIKDTKPGVVLEEINESVDLIHNHTETCLQAHECIDNSIELIENPTTCISIESSSETINNIPDLNTDGQLAVDMYSSDTQDGTELNQDMKIIYPVNENVTLFRSALASVSSANSLMTEDLSFEVPESTPTISKWYLLSENEDANTNSFDINHNLINNITGGSNLNDIFPVTCAIPNLSTITERSKETDVDTRSNFDSPIQL